jgi:hypothetical protein
MIDRFYREAEEDEREATTPWTIQNINNLLKYVALENIGQLRGCYITSKMGPSVFVEPERDDVMAESAEADKQNAKLLSNYNFSWKPKFHVDAFERETKRAPDGSLDLMAVHVRRLQWFFLPHHQFCFTTSWQYNKGTEVFAAKCIFECQDFITAT